MVSVRVGIVALGLAIAHIACARSVFTCETDADCRTQSMRGTCQTDGYCSFPDAECPSGQRYGAHAGEGRSDTCVPIEDAGTSSDASTAGPSTTTSGTESGTSDETGSSTTMPGSDSTTSQAEGSSTGERAPCSFEDWFEGDEIDRSWEVYGTVPVVQSDGELKIDLVTAEGSNFGGVRRDGDDLRQAVVTIVATSIPNPSTSAELLVNFSGGGNGMRLAIAGGNAVLYAFVDDGTQVLVNTAYDFETYDRVRFVVDALDMRFEGSAGGGQWQTVWEGAVPFDAGSVLTSLSGRTWELVDDPGTVAFDAFSICPLP